MSKKAIVLHYIKNFFLITIGYIIFLNIWSIVILAINKILYLLQRKFIFKYSKDKIEYENGQIKPFLEGKDYVIKIENDLKIMQLTDIHLGGGFLSFNKDRLAIKAIVAMVLEEKPDLVIVTGDIAYPIFFQAGAISNVIQHRMLGNIFDTLGVYWTLVFGNHDTEIYSILSRRGMSKWYKKLIEKENTFKYCLYRDEYDLDGHGNQVIKIKNSNDELIQNLVLIDSHAYAKGNEMGLKREYDFIKQSQINWAVEKVLESNVVAKTLLFIHIPLVEYRDAYSIYLKEGNTSDVQYISGDVKNKKDKLNKYNEVKYGIGASSERSDFFERLHSINSLQGVFCGHDHKNDLVMKYKGVLLSYSKPIDYLAYWGSKKQTAHRGCNMINLNSDGTFISKIEDLYDIKYKKLLNIKNKS